MNDEKLAIQTLQELLDSNFFGVLQKMAFNLAITALEKQIPYEVDCRDVVNIRWTDGYCKCNKLVDEDARYCSNCGQRLAWEVEE